MGFATVLKVTASGLSVQSHTDWDAHGERTDEQYLPRRFLYLRVTDMANALPQPYPRGDETILLVEPEPETRKLAAFMLTKQGYRVIEARNASDAIQMFDECGSPIHLLLAEAVMNRVNGHELARILESRLPGLRTLFLADSEYERMTRSAPARRGLFFLVRPFTMAILSTRVREALDAPARAMTASLRA